MDFNNFIKQVVDIGIDSAKKDYKREDQKALLRGSIAGFKACLGKSPLELSELLDKAMRESSDWTLQSDHKSKKHIDKHWYLRGYALEVEWVCNVVSCALLNQGLPTIVPPTARGMIMASKILGVRSENELL